jgi:hypothetical protein
VEALFVLNDQTHNAYNNFRASPEERARFSLAGLRPEPLLPTNTEILNLNPIL